MKFDQFAFWFQGHFELEDRDEDQFLTATHPQMPGDKESLQDIHDGKGTNKLDTRKSKGRGKTLEFYSGRRDGWDRRIMC